MRIWSIHPKYLDTKGLVAVWRESLLARHVLEGKTNGYKNHPQLIRFKEVENPVDAINQYLSEIFAEAVERGYHFDRSKIDWNFSPICIKVTTHQVDYEFKHLLKKLEKRDYERYNLLKNACRIDTVSVFEVVEGEIEQWEKVE